MIAGLVPRRRARAQTPDDPHELPLRSVLARGTIHRMFHHSAHTLQDKFVGYPETFIEPPLGCLRQRTIRHASLQGRRPPVHPLSHRLPAGDQSVLADRSIAVQYHAHADPKLARPDHTSSGPPTNPAWTSRAGRLCSPLSQRLGRPIVAERVTIGPSPYPGAMGVEAANNFTNTIITHQAAASNFALPPTESAASGVR